MFEHMKNYEFLLKKVSTWLKSGGKLFVHIFCHKSDPYDMEEGISARGGYLFQAG
jgi:cyclopropane fatty-acyl-phospholipid synthase-like methyltransferase